MPTMPVRTEIVLLLVGAGIVLVACGGNGRTEVLGGPCPSKTLAKAEIEGDLTTDKLVDLVAEAMTCPGYAFHVQSEVDYQTGDFGVIFEIDTWIDLENDVARTESVWRAASGEALREAEEAGLAEDAERRDTVIIRADARYTGTELIGYPDEENQDPVARRRRPPDCRGPGREALGALISCEGPLEDLETTVERDVSYRGRPAIALVNEGESSGSDETYYTTNRLYFDRDTFLPIGATSEGTLDIGDIFPVHADIPIEYQFVPLDSLAADFFDPASIGYVEKDLEEPLETTDVRVSVYWLGREFEGSGEYPALMLASVGARQRPQTAVRSTVDFTYRLADDEFGYILVRLNLFTPEGWNKREEMTLRQPCEETIELNIDGIQATLQRHYWEAAFEPPPCLPYDRFSATVHFDDVVVRIDAPTTVGRGTAFRSPYNSEEGLELLVRSLRLRE